ncbi:hypothetical protein MHYP_G00361660 [Metynnis hypsauchen]
MSASDSELSTDTVCKDLNETARLKASRAGTMSRITRRMNIINALMVDVTYVDEVKTNMAKFNEMLTEFKSRHESYVQLLSEEDKMEDVNMWYQPKLEQVNAFLSSVTKWLSAMENPVSPNGAQITSSDLKRTTSDDNVSIVSSVSKRSSRSGRSSTHSNASSTASACICAEAERAALMTKAVALSQKHALEKQQEQLQKQSKELRKRRETLELQTEIAATNAKIDYLKKAENSKVNSPSTDAMNEYLEEMQFNITSPIV